MGRRRLKKELLFLLSTHELDSVYDALHNYPPKLLLNPLFIALCNPVEKVRWFAACCFGRVVPAIAEDDFEGARIVMRRFLWSLNDESGGIGWGAPESMAEILCNSKGLRAEYLHMLISYMREDGEELHQDGNYLELPLLQRGLLWGVGRLCQTCPEIMREKGVKADLHAYLGSPDAQVAAMALWALTRLGCAVEPAEVEHLLLEETSLRLFEAGVIQQIPVTSLIMPKSISAVLKSL